MIKIYNRKTKNYDVEKVAGEALLNYLYCTLPGKAGLQLLIKRKFYSYFFGFLCSTKLSRGKIEAFIKDFDIDKAELLEGVGDFKSFNDFFTRKLKAGARSFGETPEHFLSPCDGRVKAWENINIDNLVQIKGISYSLKELLGNSELAANYKGGTCVLLRLAPVDYHRFHFIDSGVCGDSVKVKGQYYSVNPIALNSIPQVFCRNKREYCVFRSDNFGDIVYVEVGATSVGSIVQTYNAERILVRGEEKGYFKFGGSTIVLFLEKDTVKIDEEILLQTEMGYETKVLAGERIGLKKQ